MTVASVHSACFVSLHVCSWHVHALVCAAVVKITGTDKAMFVMHVSALA